MQVVNRYLCYTEKAPLGNTLLYTKYTVNLLTLERKESLYGLSLL